MTFKHLLFLAGLLGSTTAAAQDLQQSIADYFSSYAVSGYRPHSTMRADSMRLNETARTLDLFTNEAFASQPLTAERLADIYRDLGRRLPTPYNTYHLTLLSHKGVPLDELIPNHLRSRKKDEQRLWGKIDYDGAPWVTPLSRPYTIAHGLSGRHLMINASHGRYYRDGAWRWQRPYIYCTTEDLFTASFVTPFLIPMLENAGAIVATARERDLQSAEALVDNDATLEQGTYAEVDRSDAVWTTLGDSGGFAPYPGILTDSIQVFTLGTARQVNATGRHTPPATATWTPRLPRAGRYAVYVSYVTRPNSVSDARYMVYHKGGRTQFSVNQQMGGNTWVYLGTFDFDEGENPGGRVVLTSQSDSRGVVTADAVRFGGGMGQLARETTGTSGLPRYFEGAHYHALWSGVADSIFHIAADGSNDYNGDIRSRAALVNTLGGGSPYMPTLTGRGVPFELALAVHSDAGVQRDGSIYGTLGICTTTDSEGNTQYPSGLSRRAATDLIATVMQTVTTDLSQAYRTQWTQRELWDRNYGESRQPAVPAAILEMCSHQNFRDMSYGHDPRFKFSMARAIYKGILQYVNYQHGISDYEVQPLPVRRFAAVVTKDGEARLSWQAVSDTLTAGGARPTGYVVYTRVDDEDFDNGTYVRSTQTTLPIAADKNYSFRVTAVNGGGESFPSETLSLRRTTSAAPRVLIVNGFDRLGGPAQVHTADSIGFDLHEDLGVPYLNTAAYAGAQLNFDASAAAVEGPDGLGYCGHELMGTVIAGNSFDYPCLHGAALAANGYAYSSCSRDALLSGEVNAADYDAVDYICGLQREAPQDLVTAKTFDAATRQWMTGYLHGGGRLLVSGSFIGSDMQRDDEKTFTRDLLKYVGAGSNRADSTSTVDGLNLSLPLRRTPSAEGYCLQSPDILIPTGTTAFSAFAYGNGRSAGIAYGGSDYRVVAMGFPFESITDAEVRRKAAGAIFTFLTRKE
jgi:hypothetical protein